MALESTTKHEVEAEIPAVFRLPNDILEPIFLLLSENPFLVSHICGSWRNLALDFSALWTILILDEEIYTMTSSVDRIATHLARSKTRPLTIDFIFGGSDFGQIFSEILAMILPHAQRWKYFYLSTDDSDSVVQLYHKLQHVSVPLLEHFSVNAEIYGEKSVHSLPKIVSGQSTVFLGGAPSLTAFRAFGVPSAIFQPDLSNITGLYIRNGTTTISLAYLRGILSLSRLECLSLNGALAAGLFERIDPLQCSPPVVMPRLKHLHFAVSDLSGTSALEVLFYHIIAPELQSILFVDINIPRTTSGFAAESFPGVIQLRFLGCNFSNSDNPSDHTAFLSLFPNTRHLVMHDVLFPEVAMSFFLNTTSLAQESRYDHLYKTSILPDLLTFTCKAGPRWDFEGLENKKGMWRKGLLINPTEEELRALEVEKSLPEVGWDHDRKFPPDPRYFDQRLCTRGDYYVQSDF